MALQRPIPPPRRSKLKTFSCDVGDLETPPKLEFPVDESAMNSRKEPSSLQEQTEKEDQHNPSAKSERFSLPAQPNEPPPSPPTITESPKNQNQLQNTSTRNRADQNRHCQTSVGSSEQRISEGQKFRVQNSPIGDSVQKPRLQSSIGNSEEKSRCHNFAIDNPGYDSRTIPLRSKQLASSVPRATSNLIWFQSGVPPEFAMKTESPNRLDNTADIRPTPTQLAFSPLEGSSSALAPLPIPPPLYPAVASLYPKLPPSPVLPEPSFNLVPDVPTNGLPLNSGSATSNATLSPAISMAAYENAPHPPTPTSINEPPIDIQGDQSYVRRSIHGSVRDGRYSPAAPGLNTSIGESITLSDEDDNQLRHTIDSCKLTLDQPSIDGSFSSNPGEAINGSMVEDRWIPEEPVVTPSLVVPEPTDRLRLTPVGANVCNAGWLNKLGAKKKETVRRWCVLKNGVFDFYGDDTSDKPLESISCKTIEMVLVRLPTDLVGYDGDAAYIFTISFLATGRKLENWTFSADRQDDLLVWITLLTKCIVQSEAADMCEAVDRAGPLYLKKGTTADWEPGWFVMRGKVLLYAAEGDACCYEVDIRKVIRIRIITDGSDCCPMIQPQVPYAFVVSTEGSALYAQSHDVTTSKAWKDAIESSLTERTGLISEQRLTTDDIPILVEKCISFVAVYGLSVEGIYRHNGTLTKVKVLFEQFMKDPHDVHLRVDEYTVHDVSSALKKYFRQLDEPLVTSVLRPRLIEKSGVSERGSRILAYKRLLNELPLVSYNTLRKLLRHLKIVSQHADKNMMSTQNLAAIFGPTLFSVDGEVVEEGSSSFVSTSQAINIIADMLINCDDLFNVDSEERQKEWKIQEALQRIESHNPMKTPSQLLLSIHVLEKDANVFNMPIGSKVTASDVCAYAITHKRLACSPDQLALFEVICNGQLERILNADEKLLEIVGRWTSWPVEERASAYVIVKADLFKERMESMSGSSLLTSCDVQLSESKSFRKCTFQCSKGEILMYKNAKGTKPLQSWAVDKVFWYFGCETRRQPPTKFCLTFIEKEAIVRRNKAAPFFGRCMCFQDEKDLLRWLTTVTLSNRPLRADF